MTELRAPLLGLLLACLLALPALAEEALSFSEVTITLGEDNRIFLDAQINYKLNDTATEALENGVPLSFVTHVQMRDVDAWVWSADVVDQRLRSILRYRPLSGLYEVRAAGSDDKQVFATRSSALRFLGRIHEMALIDRGALDAQAEYLVRLDAYLDIEALPLPMRPMAYLTSDWDLQAETWEWRLRP